MNTAGFNRGMGAPPQDTLNSGNVNGQSWIPSECDVSIRPGWFYHKTEDDKLKTPEQLFELYLKSVGRGANLLLNVPPDNKGLINTHDSIALMGFNKLLTLNFKNNLVKNTTDLVLSGDSIKESNLFNRERERKFVEILSAQKETLKVHFNSPTKINCVVLKEYIQDGQSVQRFYVLAKNSKQQEKYVFSTIGRKRIVTFPVIEATDLMVYFTESKREIKISSVEAYLIDEKLVEKK